ncbi:hypothetical protein PALB_18190 [Pseudoalteromonas luteoviolacea B = ATCC 29581]|nr:hypothetical protein PALB_18190 [Pseudoalteromonas luteoviolacea B = ATCC 29581]
MLSLLLSALSWAVFDYIRKLLTQTFRPAVLAVVFAFLSLPAYFCYWLVSSAQLPVWQDYLVPALISGSLAALGSVNYLSALQRGAISKVIPILCLTPVVAAIAGWLILKEPLSFIQWSTVFGVSILCAILSVRHFSLQGKALLPALITAFSWGLCIVFDKIALKYSSVSFHLFFLTFCILALNWLILRPKIPFEKIRKEKLIFIGVSFFVCAVAFQLVALVNIHPGILEAVKRAIGVVAALYIGYFAFKERVSLSQSLICAGLILGVGILSFN